MEQFTYFGTTPTNQNSIQEEIKSSLNSRNVCYHSAQNLLPFRLICKYRKIKMYKTIILSVLYECETRSVIVTEECRLMVFAWEDI
jgi:hypothetical protein